MYYVGLVMEFLLEEGRTRVGVKAPLGRRKINRKK